MVTVHHHRNGSVHHANPVHGGKEPSDRRQPNANPPGSPGTLLTVLTDDNGAESEEDQYREDIPAPKLKKNKKDKKEKKKKRTCEAD